MSKKQEKKYQYNFSYYWGVQFENEEEFLKDQKSLKSLKAKIKRHFRIDEEGTRIYLNLKFVTTEGKIKSLFPTSTKIWATNAEEYEEHFLKSKTKKQDEFIEDNKIKIVKNENGPQIASPKAQLNEPVGKNVKRKVSFTNESEEPILRKTNKTKADKAAAKNILQQLNYDMNPADTDVTNNPLCKSPDNYSPDEYIEPQDPQIPEDKTGNNIEEFFRYNPLTDLDRYKSDSDNLFARPPENILESESKFSLYDC